MEFGIFSNGFRPHGIAADSYNEDIREIVLAEELGFRDAYISEHHGELPYINRVDTIPEPDLLMCKASALTSKIRMGSAVKLIHSRGTQHWESSPRRPLESCSATSI
jgi:limonene 1,2-monooxygenase